MARGDSNRRRETGKEESWDGYVSSRRMSSDLQDAAQIVGHDEFGQAEGVVQGIHNAGTRHSLIG